jgi:hypothetical protein
MTRRRLVAVVVTFAEGVLLRFVTATAAARYLDPVESENVGADGRSAFPLAASGSTFGPNPSVSSEMQEV